MLGSPSVMQWPRLRRSVKAHAHRRPPCRATLNRPAARRHVCAWREAQGCHAFQAKSPPAMSRKGEWNTGTDQHQQPEEQPEVKRFAERSAPARAKTREFTTRERVMLRKRKAAKRRVASLCCEKQNRRQKRETQPLNAFIFFIFSSECYWNLCFFS